MTAPNILLIMADQLAPQFTGAYDHPLVKTPHMEALAQRGTRFDAAYCNAPLCAPSRFSFMSGQLITRIAAYDNASEFPASVPTFAHYLRMMGYRTCLSGKMHFVGPDQLHGFDERVTTDVYPSDYAWTPDWELADERIDKWYHNMDSVREAGVGAATFQLDYDEEVAFFAKRRIMDYARYQTAPFCMVASFIHPHDPYVARPEWWNLYQPEQIDMPQNVLTRDQQDGFSQRLMDGIEASTVAVSEAEVRNARHAYYANTSYFDSKVGELVKTLEEAELLDNTIVMVTADHGDMLGERGLWYKMNFFEHSARVPLIVAGPGVLSQHVSNACSLVDILPTLLDIAATDAPRVKRTEHTETGTETDHTSTTKQPTLGQPIDGRSLLPLLQGQDDATDEAIGEYCAEMTSHPVIMIRRGAFKYIHCDADAPLLYNLQDDPSEVHNLATDPDHATIARDFAAEITARWNSKAIRADVIATQKTRRAIYAAMDPAHNGGSLTCWDYQPHRDASNEYVRNHMDWTVAAATTRFPPLASASTRQSKVDSATPTQPTGNKKH